MTSINTNASAMTALQALKRVNWGLDKTQAQVSTGLRISESSHNAAYWSIATTMRSDNKTLSAVEDALGLAAAQVDVMYAATESIVGVLSDFKARLALAKSDGLDRQKIQLELKALVEQAQSIVSSASAAGSNWLETHETANLHDSGPLTTSVVASFTRSPSGHVSLGKIDVDLKNSSMLNAGGGGILQKHEGIGDIGGLKDTGINSIAHQGHQDYLFTGPGTFGAADFIEFVMNVDASAHTPGVDHTVRIDKAVIDAALGTSDGVIASADAMRRVLERAFQTQGVPATTNSYYGGSPGTRFEIGSLEAQPGHPGSSITVTSVTSSFPGNSALGLENQSHFVDHDNMYPSANVAFSAPFTLGDGIHFSFDVEVGPGGRSTVTVDRATVSAALGTSDGQIGNAAQMATVLQFAAQGRGLAVQASGGTMTFSADPSMYPEAGNRAARVYFGNVRSNASQSVAFDLAEVDVTRDDLSVDAYLAGVDTMLAKAIDSASDLGSLKRRIDLQKGFLDKLRDAMDRGIGQLVDTDMNKASARLTAFQTQQQLAIQSLQIANSTTQQLVRLFQ